MQIAAVPVTSRWNQPDAWTGRAVTFQSNRRRSPSPGNGILERTDLAVFSLLLLHSRVCRRTAFKYCACNGTSGTGQRERGSELASASNVECVSGKREFATRDKGAERVELIMRMIELSARRHCQQSAEGDGKKKAVGCISMPTAQVHGEETLDILAQRSRGCSCEIAVSASILRRSPAQPLILHG